MRSPVPPSAHLRLGLGLALVLTLSAAGRGTPQNPAPTLARQWVTSVRWDGGEAGRLEITPQLLLAQDYTGRNMVALDPRTGRALWQQQRSATFLDEGLQEQADGQLLGWTRGPEEVLVLSFRTAERARPGASGPLWRHGVRLKALLAGTGRTRWQLDLPDEETYTPVTVVNDVLVLLKQKPEFAVELRDAHTGRELASPPAGLSVSTPLVTTASWQGLGLPLGVLLDPRRMEARVLKPLRYLDWVTPPSVVGDRIVARIDLDDGMLGHSVAPKWVECTNLAGKSIWRFPRRFRYAHPDALAPVTPSVDRLRVNATSGTAAVLSDRLRGIRVRDGRLLWQLPRDLYFQELAPFGQGFLGLQPREAEGKEFASLGYVSHSGKVRWPGRLPAVGAIATSGDRLYLADRGSISAYRVRP
jgi:hypothetical protein